MVKTSLLNELKKDISEKRIGYNRRSIVSWLNSEQSYQKRYKGREILEIIQNAEDANAKNLSFEINRDLQKITIANDGENFSLEGYSSLLYPNISPKPKGVFIGQKGLGFRALINWATEISIFSNGFKITFSEDISQKLLTELKKEKTELHGISEMQFLSIPIIEELETPSHGVKIEIKYKENIDFDSQFKTLDEECFFFLSSLNQITTPISRLKKMVQSDFIIQETTNELPEIYYDQTELKHKNERKIYYNIKLIYKPNKDYTNYPLYCYFKTNVKIGSPILIHATFDLSDDRNSIEKTERNKFLINEICLNIEKLIDKITQTYKDWSAYELLNHSIRCELDSDFEKIGTCFYNCIENKEIYPCIDGILRKHSDVVVVNKEIVDFIRALIKQYKNIDFSIFNNIVLIDDKTKPFLNINSEKYYDIFNDLSKKIPTNDIANRCLLINLFYKFANEYCDKKPAIFIDNNLEIIPEDDEVFTVTDGKIDTTLIPAFCKYRTINSNLTRKLLNENILSQNQIESCINKIYPGDITNLFLICIDWLSYDISDSQKEEIYLALFKMHKKYGLEIDIQEEHKFPIFCEDGEYHSENVIFNFGFNANDNILDIINPFIKRNDEINCIANKEYWTFLQANDIELTNFFRFLKVSDSVNYEIVDSQAELFVDSISKEDLVKLAIIDTSFYDFIKTDSSIVNQIKAQKLFSDYVINTKKINFLNNGLLDKSGIKKLTRDENLINNILQCYGAQDTMETISAERFNIIIKNLNNWDPDGDFAGRIYDQAFKNEVQIKGETKYFSKDKGSYLPNKQLYYYDNKCLPSSKLQEFPTIDLGRRKGHAQVSKLFNITSIETYKIQIIGKPEIDLPLTTLFVNDLEKFYPLILAYRFCSASTPLSDEMKKRQASALKNISIKICRNLNYSLNNSLEKETLKDFDFINIDGIFYLKIPADCKTLVDIRMHKKDLYDFISEMLLMTFKLTENNSYIKDTAVQTYIFDDLAFSESRFEDDNERTILREAKDYLDEKNHREEFWKHIWKLKNITEDYDIWEQKQRSKKIYSKLDYKEYSEDMEALFEEDDVNIDKTHFFQDYPCSSSVNFSEYNKIKFRDIYNIQKINIENYIWLQCCKKKDNQRKYLEKINSIQWNNNIENLFCSYNYIVDNYEKALWTKLKKEKNFDIDKIKEVIDSNIINREEIYFNNCSLFKPEALDIIKQYYEWNSLLYFENTYDDIVTILLESENKKRIVKDKDIKENNEATILKDIDSYTYSNKNLSPSKRKGNNRTSYSSKQRSTSDIEKGEIIQQKALKYLQDSNKYLNINDVSEFGRGYDIECIEKATKTLIYIEVKSFEKDYFEMTENEYNTWMSNKNIYKFFLRKESTKENFWVDGEKLQNKFKITSSKYKCKLI